MRLFGVLVALMISGCSSAAWACPEPVPYVHVERTMEVFWGSSWWVVDVLQVSGGSAYIHYRGYSDSWNEWVEVNRLRDYRPAPVYRPVVWEWHGYWYGHGRRPSYNEHRGERHEGERHGGGHHGHNHRR